jgi:hypothetical protein
MPASASASVSVDDQSESTGDLKRLLLIHEEDAFNTFRDCYYATGNEEVG